MAIDYSVDLESGFVSVKVTNETGMTDVRIFMESMAEAIPEGDEPLDFLVEVTGVKRSDFGMSEMDSIAKKVDRLHWNGRVRKEAIVANQKTVLGLLVLYRQFSQGGRDIQIFKTTEDALRWLEEGAIAPKPNAG